MNVRALVAEWLHRLAAVPDDPAVRALSPRPRAELVAHVLAQCAAQRRLLEDLGVTMLAPPATLEEIDAIAKQLDALAHESDGVTFSRKRGVKMPRPTIGKQVRYFTANGKERPAFLLSWEDRSGVATVSVLHHPREDGQRGGHVYEDVPFLDAGDDRREAWDWREEDYDAGEHPRAGTVYTPPSSASSPATSPSSAGSHDDKPSPSSPAVDP